MVPRKALPDGLASLKQPDVSQGRGLYAMCSPLSFSLHGGLESLINLGVANISHSRDESAGDVKSGKAPARESKKLKCVKIVTCYNCKEKIRQCLAILVKIEIPEDEILEDGVFWVSEDPVYEEEEPLYYDAEVWFCGDCVESLPKGGCTLIEKRALLAEEYS